MNQKRRETLAKASALQAQALIEEAAREEGDSLEAWPPTFLTRPCRPSRARSRASKRREPESSCDRLEPPPSGKKKSKRTLRFRS